MQGSGQLLRRRDPTHWPWNQKLGGRSPRAQPFESPETSSNKVTALSLPTEEIRPKMQGSLKSVTFSNHPKIRMTGSWFLCKKRVNEPQRELRLRMRETGWSQAPPRGTVSGADGGADSGADGVCWCAFVISLWKAQGTVTKVVVLW